MDSKIYQQVTDRIIAQLEAGTRPWQRTWTDAAGVTVTGAMQRPLRSNGVAYTGVNTINLWCAAQLRGFNSRHWMTYKTAAEMGGQVRKGAKAELAFYVGKHTVRDDKAANPEDTEREISFMRCYSVFNCDEIDGLPARFYADRPAIVVPADESRIDAVDSFVFRTGASVSHGGNRAFFSPAQDAIRMPTFKQFDRPESYYATLLHELVHWTGHDSRLARGFGLVKRWGDDHYAAEELVAELGSAFLSADLEISAEPRADHADYIASWLRVLKGDNKAIFKAATLADKAAGYLHKLQPADGPEPAPIAPAEPAAPAPAPVVAEPEPAPVAEPVATRKRKARPAPAIAAPVAKPATRRTRKGAKPAAAPIAGTLGDGSVVTVAPDGTLTIAEPAPAPAPVVAEPAPVAEPEPEPAPAPAPVRPRMRRGRKQEPIGASPDPVQSSARKRVQRGTGKFAQLLAMPAAPTKVADYDSYVGQLRHAQRAAVAELGDNWRVRVGVLCRLPAKWVACKVFGRVAKAPRDTRLPPGKYWPAGQLPAGPEYGDEGPRETGPVDHAAYPHGREGGNRYGNDNAALRNAA